MPAQHSAPPGVEGRHAACLEDDELSNEEIQQLLKDAEARLRQKATVARQPQDFKFTLPKLDTSSAIQPYIETTNAVAELDKSWLEKEASQKLASRRPRRLEDPVAVKSNKEKVRANQESSCLLRRGSCDENYPISFLDAESESRLEHSSATRESFKS